MCDMGEDYDVDLAVIGSGGAAMSAAIAASQAGKSVVLIERGVLGGTCVNIGCVPSKTLLAAAGARHAALTNPFAGVPTSAGPVDLGALVAQKDGLIESLREAKYADVAAAYGFEVRSGQAAFLNKDTMAVDGAVLRARAYLIATGSTPAVPDVAGLESVDWLTSTTAMELTELPKSLVVIGGGYVGMEQAQLFAHLGARVSVVGRLAPHAEPELAQGLREVFADDGITVVEEHATAVATGIGPHGQDVGVNPWKWTHQCVLSGGNVHHKCVIDLEVNRCSITQTRMSPPRVVSNQPPKHLTTTLEVRDPPLRSLQRLPLQRRVDRLRQGIISTRPDPAHRLDHPEPTTHRLKRRGRILTTMVAVKNRTFQCFSVVYCIL
jgi:thioredoxin reductase